MSGNEAHEHYSGLEEQKIGGLDESAVQGGAVEAPGAMRETGSAAEEEEDEERETHVERMRNTRRRRKGGPVGRKRQSLERRSKNIV